MPSRLYVLPVVVATSPHFPRFPLKNQYATPVTPHRGIIEGTFKCSTRQLVDSVKINYTVH